MKIEQVTLSIDNLGRENTSALVVAGALASVKGVMRVGVIPATDTVRVQYDPDRVHVADLMQAVTEAGFLVAKPELRA